MELTKQSPGDSFLGGFAAVGPDRRIWEGSRPYVERTAKHCDDDEIVVGQPYSFEAIFMVPQRYADQLAGYRPDRPQHGRAVPHPEAAVAAGRSVDVLGEHPDRQPELVGVHGVAPGHLAVAEQRVVAVLDLEHQEAQRRSGAIGLGVREPDRVGQRCQAGGEGLPVVRVVGADPGAGPLLGLARVRRPCWRTSRTSRSRRARWTCRRWCGRCRRR